MAYKYRGTIRDLIEPIDAEPGEAVFDPAKCGSVAGHKQHRKFNTEACRPCKDAFNKYYREWKVRRKAGLTVPKFSDDKCGTMAGYSRHRRHDVPLCEPCRTVRRGYRSDYYDQNAA